MSLASRAFRNWWWTFPTLLFFLLCIGAGYFYFWPEALEARIRRSATLALKQRFDSEVELRDLQIKLLPRLSVVGHNLTLRYHGRTDMPPLVQIETFSFSGGFLSVLRPVKHIPLVRIENLQITIPPRDPAYVQTPPHAKPLPQELSSVVIDRVVCDHADIRIMPRKPGSVPLDWDIHNLALTSASASAPFEFHGSLTNGKPVGEIVTDGTIGPWNKGDPGGTPVSGEYRFTDADLTPLPGIGGTLSSTGKFSGVLAELEVQGETDTPDFSLDASGSPLPLHTVFSATVNGMNGDTLLHPVTAVLAQSVIVAEGKVVRVPGSPGHLVSIEANVPNGRIQDFLKLAIRSEKPALSGSVKIKAKLIFPPGKKRALEKISLDGDFGVAGGNWSSLAMREKLESLSRHAMGKPEEQDAGSAITDLAGNFFLRHGVLHFRELSFHVEGAAVTLAGTYSLVNGELDLAGHLTLQAKLSQTVNGTKSFFLRALDPFFKKNGAGTVLPIRISGTRVNPIFAVGVFHKSFDKQSGPRTTKSR
jgi:hypothetical protein